MRSISTLGFKAKFDTVRSGYDLLRGFPDHIAVLDHLHGKDGDREFKDSVLAALIRAAQDGDLGRQVAVPVLWLALWPGLDAIYHRLRPQYSGRTDDLVSEISERFLSGVHGLDLRRVRRVAATLLRNIERDSRAALRANRREVPLEEDLSAEMAAGVGGPNDLAFGGDTDREDRATIRKALGTLPRGDTDIVVRVIWLGERPFEIADRLGITPTAARKRYQRAIQRLRKNIGFGDDGLSHSADRTRVFPLRRTQGA